MNFYYGRLKFNLCNISLSYKKSKMFAEYEKYTKAISQRLYNQCLNRNSFLSSLLMRLNVVVTQLAERSHLIPEVHGSYYVSCKYLY